MCRTLGTILASPRLDLIAMGRGTGGILGSLYGDGGGGASAVSALVRGYVEVNVIILLVFSVATHMCTH